MELFFFFNKLNIIKNITMYILSLIYNITSKPPRACFIYSLFFDYF